MYGFEALWFNIKDGYLGMLRRNSLLPWCYSTGHANVKIGGIRSLSVPLLLCWSGVLARR